MRCVVRAPGRFLAAVAGCILSFEAAAGQLSFAPTISFTADTDSNRNLVPEGTASQSASLQLSADLTGSTETTAFTLTPMVRYQAFDTHELANIFERDTKFADMWTGERLKLTLTGEDSDKSTLTTELTETGILSSQLHQRSAQGSLSASYDQTERTSLIVTGSYTDVSYYGAPDSSQLNLLSGYRYPAASIGEQFAVSETSTLRADINYSEVLILQPGADSRTTGGDLNYHGSFSDTFDLDATIGASAVRAADTRHVTTGNVSLTRKLELGSIALSYTRSLTPYGTGTLVERQVYTASVTKSLTDQLDVTLSGSHVQNTQLNNILQELGLPPQVQTYNAAQVLFAWKFAEYWRLNANVDTTQVKTVEFGSLTAHRWSAGVTLVWTPLPRTTGF